MVTVEQLRVCEACGANACPPAEGSRVGVSANLRGDSWPLNGLRHRAEGSSNGWYLWRGDTLSTADDFFEPLHVEPLYDWCPEVERFLALPPGWRFLIAPGFEDVWFDPSLFEDQG